MKSLAVLYVCSQQQIISKGKPWKPIRLISHATYVQRTSKMRRLCNCYNWMHYTNLFGGHHLHALPLNHTKNNFKCRWVFLAAMIWHVWGVKTSHIPGSMRFDVCKNGPMMIPHFIHESISSLTTTHIAFEIPRAMSYSYLEISSWFISLQQSWYTVLPVLLFTRKI